MGNAMCSVVYLFGMSKVNADTVSTGVAVLFLFSVVVSHAANINMNAKRIIGLMLLKIKISYKTWITRLNQCAVLHFQSIIFWNREMLSKVEPVDCPNTNIKTILFALLKAATCKFVFKRLKCLMKRSQFSICSRSVSDRQARIR